MKKYLAELIGTFVLVFDGCGAAVLAGDHIGYLGVSFAFGLTLLTMAYAIGPIWLFIVAPVIGAILASIVFRVIGANEPVLTAEKAESALDSEVAERSK